MKVYIAGKITGLPQTEFVANFKNVENILKDKGNQVLNPTRLFEYELEYEQYMAIDRILIEAADAVYMLKNWEDSPGAMRDREHAIKLGKKIYYE